MCLFHNFHLDVAAGHGKDDAQDGDVEQHGKEEPAFRVGPHLKIKLRNLLFNICLVMMTVGVTHSVPEAKHEDGGDEGGDEQAPCHQQVNLPGCKPFKTTQ